MHVYIHARLFACMHTLFKYVDRSRTKISEFHSFKEGPILHFNFLLQKSCKLTHCFQRLHACNYKGCKVLLYNNGLIAVVVSDKKWDYFADNQIKAKEILNEIIGTSNLFGVRGVSFNIHDLTFFAIGYDEMEIIATMSPIQFTTRSLIAQVSTSDVATHSHKSLMEIEKDKLLEIISNAEKLTSNAKIKSYISTYLDAVTHFYVQEYKASFLLSWILLEKHIEDVWQEALQKNEVGKKRFKKLVGIFWSADDKIECLNLLGYFSKERYSKLMSLKTLRNKILHEDVTVDREKTKRSLDLCKTTILEVTKKARSK